MRIIKNTGSLGLLIMAVVFLALVDNCMAAAAERAGSSTLSNIVEYDLHHPLARAARWACDKENINLLRALLQAGLPVNDAVDEDGKVMLHFAVLQRSERVAKFLLANGATASCHVRDRCGLRPIDFAYEHGWTNMCNILACPDENNTIDGIPNGLLDAIFCKEQKEAVLISLNGEDPSDKFISYANLYWDVISPSNCEEKVSDKYPQKMMIKEVVDKKTKNPVATFSISLVAKPDGSYDFKMCFYRGPLNGWFQCGIFIKKYGYWFKIEEEGGVM